MFEMSTEELVAEARERGGGLWDLIFSRVPKLSFKAMLGRIDFQPRPFSLVNRDPDRSKSGRE